jgi:activating signal cointegrator 1
MKVLSLLQPWATLVVIGAKKIETRSWNTNYRGPVLIHASKKKIPELLRLQCSWQFDAALHSLGGTMTPGNKIDFARDLPFGAIVGMVEIDNCRPADSFTIKELDSKKYPQGRITNYWTERQLGDYAPGRFGWELSNPVAFPNNVAAKGSLGLWEFSKKICLHCGCTDNDCRHCIETTGKPCYWVKSDLCSACASKIIK